MKTHFPSTLLGAGAVCLFLLLSSLSQSPTATRLRTLTPEEDEILSHLSIVFVADGQGTHAKTVRLSGVNFQLVNGLGATNGFPPDPVRVDEAVTQVNGLGNLIIGYDENSPKTPHDRTGSHNLVLGMDNSYSSFGGLVAGRANQLLAPCASIVAGELCEVSGAMSSVCGGEMNTAEGLFSTVGGGSSRSAPGDRNWAAGNLLESK